MDTEACQWQDRVLKYAGGGRQALRHAEGEMKGLAHKQRWSLGVDAALEYASGRGTPREGSAGLTHKQRLSMRVADAAIEHAGG